MAHPGEFGRSMAAWAATEHETLAAPDAHVEERVAAPRNRYAVEATIGKGGMGEVLLVEDRDLRREVAMKLVRQERGTTSAERLRFLGEAQATSQLEHPGIPPVHDIGVTPEGRMYFTMKLVRGRTLREVLKDLLLGAAAARREYTLHRLASILERVAEALHFAHAKGVVHRDLKPENIMLGEYGEVHVVDWGIAKVRGQTDDAGEAAVETTGTDAALMTMEGAIKGTIPYMSPEQAAGRSDEIDRRTDVYALGCLLYEMLTLHPAFEEHHPGALLRVRDGDFRPVTERNPKRAVPETLGDLCTRAMALDPSDRPATAKAFGEELRGWLDGRADRERRHAEAERLAADGKQAAARYRRRKGEVTAAERFAEEEAAKFKSWQPVAEKRSAIEAAKRVTQLKDDLVAAFADATNLFNAALAQEEQNVTARQALCDLWRMRLEDAEREGDRNVVVFAERNIRRHDDGRLAAFLAGDGTLELASDPPGAQVLLYRFEEVDGVLRPTRERSLGTTPLGPVGLPMGSYLCLLREDGFRDVRYPVHITRNRGWKGTVRMRTDDEIGEDFVYVPGGPFIDGEEQDRCEKTVGDFAIARYPVTFGEWAEYLQAVEAEEGVEAAASLIPSVKGDGVYMERSEDGAYRPLPVNIEGDARERCLRDYGDDMDWQLPVAGVSWFDAVAYCAWKTRTTGREWRLPSLDERVKAARGVDGRVFPWGDLWDSSLAKCRTSRDEYAQPEPVGTFPTAASVYGMRDAAGNQWDWTGSWLSERRIRRAIRGGSWSTRLSALRCAYGNGYRPALRDGEVGLRCARDQ